MAESLAITFLSLESEPPPPIRYFDLLPPELLRHILRRIDAAPYKDRRERQATLYSLSLCSKLLHELSQPLLLKRIYCCCPYSLDVESILAALVAQNSTDSLAKVQTLHLKDYYVDTIFYETNLEILLRNATKLQEVLIYGEFYAVQILRSTNITTLSLHNFESYGIVGDLTFPQLVNLSLYGCEGLEVGQFSVPKLKHLALLPSPVRDQPFSPEELQLLDQVAPTLASLTIELHASPSLPPSICSSSISLLIRTSLYSPTPSTLPHGTSILITLPKYEKGNFGSRDYASERAKLEDWTKLASTSDHQLEAIYLAIRTEGGEEVKVNPAIAGTVNGLVSTSQQQRVPLEIFGEEGNDEGCSFSDLVPASFTKRSEARFEDAHRV